MRMCGQLALSNGNGVRHDKPYRHDEGPGTEGPNADGGLGHPRHFRLPAARSFVNTRAGQPARMDGCPSMSVSCCTNATPIIPYRNTSSSHPDAPSQVTLAQIPSCPAPRDEAGLGSAMQQEGGNLDGDPSCFREQLSTSTTTRPLRRQSPTRSHSGHCPDIEARMANPSQPVWWGDMERTDHMAATLLTSALNTSPTDRPVTLVAGEGSAF